MVCFLGFFFLVSLLSNFLCCFFFNFSSIGLFMSFSCGSNKTGREDYDGKSDEEDEDEEDEDDEDEAGSDLRGTVEEGIATVGRGRKR